MKKKHMHEPYIYRYDGEGPKYKCRECWKEIVLKWDEHISRIENE
jgi:hypothetical protein